MKKLFDCADYYMGARDWKMMAALKFCLCSMGVLLGLSVPEKSKKSTKVLAGMIFSATYIPLMLDFFSFAKYFLKVEELTEE